MYTFVPEMIKYYLNEEPIIPNVPTWVCRDPEQLAHVLDHLDELVVKATDGAGGYGMLIGPHATEAERAEFAVKLRDNPGAILRNRHLPSRRCQRLPVIPSRAAMLTYDPIFCTVKTSPCKRAGLPVWP